MILQEKITLLTLQLKEREETIRQLMKNIKGIQFLGILLYQIICLDLQSQVIKFRDPESHELLRDQIQGDDPQLSEMFEEVLASQQEPLSDEKITQEESDDRVYDMSKLTSSDHKTAGITSQSKIQKFIGNIREQFDWLVTCSIMLNI